MNNEQKFIGGVAIVCVLIFGAASYFSRPVVNVAPVAPPASVVVSGDANGGENSGVLVALLQGLSEQIAKLTNQQQTPNTNDVAFGAGTSNFNSNLHTRADLTVDGNATITGTTTFSGAVVGNAVVSKAYSSYSSSASSQTLCAIQNTGSLNRVLDATTLVYATSTATGGGAQRFTISLSATQGATGTGSNLLLDTSLAVPTNGIQNITTTSTLRFNATSTGFIAGGQIYPGTPIIWKIGDYLNFLIASPTSTLSGDCRAIYY